MMQDEREADQQEEQAGEPVLETDDLVIGGEDIPAEHVVGILSSVYIVRRASTTVQASRRR